MEKFACKSAFIVFLALACKFKILFIYLFILYNMQKKIKRISKLMKENS